MEETCEITVMRHTDFVTMEGEKKSKGRENFRPGAGCGGGQGLPTSVFQNLLLELSSQKEATPRCSRKQLPCAPFPTHPPCCYEHSQIPADCCLTLTRQEGTGPAPVLT